MASTMDSSSPVCPMVTATEEEASEETVEASGAMEEALEAMAAAF